MFESGLVIFFPVVRSGSTVRLCGEFVEFGSFFVRVNWHSVSNPWCPLHLVIFAFSRPFNYVHSLPGQLLTPDSRAYRRSGIAPRHGGVCRGLLAPF